MISCCLLGSSKKFNKSFSKLLSQQSLYFNLFVFWGRGFLGNFDIFHFSLDFVKFNISWSKKGGAYGKWSP